jgi:sulfite reductase alpha subunit-like flavoprotein
MSDKGDFGNGPISARVVHKSMVVDQPGCRQVSKIMLNLAPGNTVFEAGANIAFLPSSDPAAESPSALRHYTIEAVGEVPFEDTVDITVYVRHSEDEGAASVGHRLHELAQGETVSLFGPYPYPFYPPMGSRSNVVMIGAGAGMVPFRWLARKIQNRRLDWMGKVLLLHGDKTGFEHLYLNDATDDQDQYFDTPSYRAFESLKTRYSAKALDHADSARANMDALWRLLGQGSVYVYLAGYRDVANALDKAMESHLRLAGRWQEAKADLVKDGHWLEMLYD